MPSEWSLNIHLNVVMLPTFQHINLSPALCYVSYTLCSAYGRVPVPVPADMDDLLRLCFWTWSNDTQG